MTFIFIAHIPPAPVFFSFVHSVFHLIGVSLVLGAHSLPGALRATRPRSRAPCTRAREFRLGVATAPSAGPDDAALLVKSASHLRWLTSAETGAAKGHPYRPRCLTVTLKSQLQTTTLIQILRRRKPPLPRRSPSDLLPSHCRRHSRRSSSRLCWRSRRKSTS